MRILYDTRFQIVVVVVFVLAGILHTLFHLDYPIIRNSLIYAGIVDAINQYGVFSRMVAAEAHEKSLGFPLLAWPLAKLFGLSSGLKALSVLGTSVWAFVVLLFYRHVLRGKGEEKSPVIALALVITLFNPLALYQFSSAYPDTCFAACFLLAVIYMDKSLSAEARPWHGSVWILALLASLWFKHHGLVLFAFAAIFGIIRWRVLADQWRMTRALLWAWVLPAAVGTIVVLAARQKLVPTFNLARDQSSFLRGFRLEEVVSQGLEGAAAFLVLAYSIFLLLPVVSRTGNHLRRLKPEWALVTIFFFGTLMVYNGTSYNVRYFLAISPLFALGLALLFMDLSRPGKVGWLGVFLAVNLSTVLYYNIPSFHRIAWPYAPLPFVDNLRLTAQQYAERQNLSLIRKYAPKHNNTLVHLSRYYGDGTFGIWQKTGDLPADLKIHSAKYWDHKMIDELGIEKAVIYEYVATGPEKHYLWLDKDIQKHLTKRNNRLFLLDLTAKRER